MKHQAQLNRIWCQVILEELSRFGVKHVCIAPGSRSTPLTLEADDNNQLEIHTHFDERGLGYLALGIAKASHQPVAIVVTSGTAVANVLPSVAEANLNGEKLVVLTADRPIELVGCGANQAINQNGIFSEHVTDSVALPSPNTNTPLNWLLTTIDDAMFKQALTGGPIHINCPFPEPLYGNDNDATYSEYLNQVRRWLDSGETYCKRVYQPSMYVPIDPELFAKKGLIVLGQVTLKEALEAKRFAASLGWPLLADPQSGVTSEWAHYDLWLQNRASEEALSNCELIIQLGAQIVSKRMNAWLEKQVMSGCEYLYVSPRLYRNNQSHLAQTHYVADPCTRHLLLTM